MGEREEEDDDDEIKIIDLHLDSKRRIDYFGQHASKEQQLNILNQMLKFENINQNSENKLIEWENKERAKELMKKKQRAETDLAQIQEFDTMIQKVNHDKTNVSASITSIGDRYSLSFYCFADNTHIINKFKTNTTKLEQSISQLWNNTFGIIKKHKRVYSNIKLAGDYTDKNR